VRGGRGELCGGEIVAEILAIISSSVEEDDAVCVRTKGRDDGWFRVAMEGCIHSLYIYLSFMLFPPYSLFSCFARNEGRKYYRSVRDEADTLRVRGSVYASGDPRTGQK
jgi:hypothetical protein